VILEDDYDAELREAGAPMPALCALDDPVGGGVVTMGTFSKLLSADVGVGYLVVPRRLLPAVLRVREALGVPVPWIAQAALADYLRSGDMQRHLARLRRRYRRRRETVAQMFAEVAGVRVLPMDGGLHSVVEVLGDERRLLNACVRSGVRVTGLSDYWGEDASGRAHGLVIGCANPEADAFTEGVRRIRRLVVSGA
jgi:GntR family transcriptional regulator/MocR family aminotransferase